MALVDDALALAAKGWPVFPTGGPRGKAPLGGHGFKDATTDPDAIRAMFADRRAKQVGVALPANTWAIDVDRRDRLPMDLGAMQETPSGGFHAMPFSGNGVEQSTFAWGDTRVGGKGYLVAWQPERWPALADLTEATPDVAAMVAPRAMPVTATQEYEEVEAWGKGERNAQLTAYAGTLRANGATYNEAKAAIEVANRERCVPPLTTRELEATVLKSLRSWERGADPVPMPKITVRSASASPLVTVSARDLLAKPPPRPIEVVAGLIPAGLSLLAAKPKIGKSWLMYQASVAIATGSELLGQTAAKGDVLYLALEDGEYRAWSRISSILGRTHDRATMPRTAADLDVAFLAGRGDEMVQQVEDWLARHADARFVAIDTLQKIRPRSSGKRNQYELDVEDVGRVLGITKRHPELALVVVHHDRKERGDDFLDAVSGTHGISGSVDTTLVLRRRRHESTGTLEVTGRDVRESLIHLAYDELSPFWSVDPHGGLTDEQRDAYDWLAANGEAGPTEIGKGIGSVKSNAHRIAERLANRGMVERLAGGRYRVIGLPNLTFRKNDENATNGENSENGENDG